MSEMLTMREYLVIGGPLTNLAQFKNVGNHDREGHTFSSSPVSHGNHLHLTLALPLSVLGGGRGRSTPTVHLVEPGGRARRKLGEC
ncbi:hypothetical protein TNIN_350411 [Trichonephila inaurata madagascariensis]|uniref:Uncharacterized protein n=1 Tax=Trichonephila inaurata madagascariensis TaxID=2747483 RepID=A0A8X7CS18_9ARAC|nr:hypothetical protein TNIN_350411 [Trichonephila inaurata madagascariensis]